MSSCVKIANDNFLFSETISQRDTTEHDAYSQTDTSKKHPAIAGKISEHRSKAYWIVVYDSPGTPTDTSIRTARILTSRLVSTISSLYMCFFSLDVSLVD